MVNQQLEAILEKLKSISLAELEPLRTLLRNNLGGSFEPSIKAIELDCLREGYFPEYHQLVALIGYNPPEMEIQTLELDLLVAGELKRYDSCCTDTKISPSVEQIKSKEKELLSTDHWKEYRRMENHAKVGLSPKEMKPFEETLHEKQEELLILRHIDEYFKEVDKTRICLPKPQIEKVLTGYLVGGEWGNYLELSERAEVKLSQKQLGELKTKIEVAKCQIKDFEEGLTYGHFHPFSMSRECLGFMPEPSKIQAIQCEYLLRLLDDTNHRYRTCLKDKRYQESVKVTGVSVSLEQLELLDGLTHYKKR